MFAGTAGIGVRNPKPYSDVVLFGKGEAKGPETLLTLIRILLGKGYEWSYVLNVVMGAGDVHKAFDELSPKALQIIFTDLQVPANLAASVLSEDVGLELKPFFGSVTCDSTVAYNASIKQGSPISSWLWELAARWCAGPLLQGWHQQGGPAASLEELGSISHAFWADGFFFSVIPSQTLLP